MAVRTLAAREALASNEADVLARMEWLANLMDSRLRIPGTNVRFGLDPIFGLVPVLGDAFAALFSLYIVVNLADLGLPLWTKLRMLWNVFFDFATGSVPVAGDILDVFVKCNNRNVALARRALQKKASRRR
jgi:hypothetical protein